MTGIRREQKRYGEGSLLLHSCRCDLQTEPRRRLECIYQQDGTYSLSPKLDAPGQSSKKSRRDLLHPCRFLSDSFWNFVEFHCVEG